MTTAGTPAGVNAPVQCGAGIKAVMVYLAMRFGQARGATAEGENPVVVRNAFNSPFRTFALVTTSVGQDGLDFHHYAHAVDDDMAELEEIAESDATEQQYWHEPLWFLLKHQTAVAVLDEDGYAHLARGRLNLMDIYDASDGDLAAMAALMLHEPTDTFALNVVMEEW